MLKLLQMAIGADLLPELPQGDKLDYGQLLSTDGEHEVLVWDSNEYSANELFNKIKEEIVKEGGSARPLTTVCRGKNIGTLPQDGRIRSNRLVDISSPSPTQSESSVTQDDRDICEANDRVVYWKNQGRIDDLLTATDTAEDFKENLTQEITLPK